MIIGTRMVAPGEIMLVCIGPLTSSAQTIGLSIIRRLLVQPSMFDAHTTVVNGSRNTDMMSTAKVVVDEVEASRTPSLH